MKIGPYSIPSYRLESLLADVKKIYDQFQGGETTKEFIAHTLGHSPTSGGFYQKMADLKAYGLIEGRGDKVKVSDLGKMVTYETTAAEKNQAFVRIVNNIPLWKILYEKYGVNIKDEGFWIDLAQITALERPEAQKLANIVRKAYLEDARYIKPAERIQEPINNENKHKEESEDRKSKMEVMPTITSNPVLNDAPNAILTLNYDYPGAMSGKLVVKDRPTLNFLKSLYDMAEEQLKARESLKKEPVTSTQSSTEPQSSNE